MKPKVHKCIRKRYVGTIQNTSRGTFCKQCHAQYYPIDEDPMNKEKPQPLGWSK